MPTLAPVIISLVISVLALNLSLSHDFFKAKDFFRSGKVLGASETDVVGSITEDAKYLNGFISGKVKDIGSLNALASTKVQVTLPVNATVIREPVKKENAAELDLSVKGGIVIDLKSGKTLFSKSPESISSIASISKLMTALVFLDRNPGWDREYRITAEDMREGGRIYISTGDTVKVRDLFYSSLVASDNIATIALVRSTGLTEAGFVDLMNKKASDLGLADTQFTDPVGLSDANTSNALEVARFAQAALSNAEIKKASLTKKYGFQTLEGKQKTIYNTDNLLSIFPKNGIEIKGGKTGYTEAAGYCFVGEFTDADGHDVISVILGSAEKDSRFTETHELVGWAYGNYSW